MRIPSLPFLAFIFSTVAIYACGEKAEGTKAIIKDITESVYSSVSIAPDSSYEVYPVISGIIEQVFVEEGDSVIIGSPLFQIKNTTPELNVASAKNNLELAKVNAGANSPTLNSIRDEIRTTQLKLSQDSINYERQASLWAKQIGTRAEYEQRKLVYESSKNQLESLKRRLQLSKIELQTQLRNAQNSYLQATSNTSDFLIESEINGLVYEVNKKKGELVVPQQKLAYIGKAKAFKLEMMIDETDITKLRPGQKIIVVLDAYKGETFEAELSKIFPNKDERTQTFKVEGFFTSTPPILYPGLSGEVNIIVNKKTNVLTLPNSFINENNEVKTKDGALKIETGLKSMEFTEVISGIDTSTVLFPW